MVNAITNKIAIIGSFPPPSGGAAIHTLRLSRLLEERNVQYVIYNAASMAKDGERVVSIYQHRALWLFKYVFGGRERCLYIMSPRIISWLFGALMSCLRKRTVLVRIQNSLLIDWVNDSRFKRACAGFALRRLDGVVCVNDALACTIINTLGVSKDKVHVIPGFLPPIPVELDRREIPAETWDFVKDHTPLIVANGKVAQYRGEDLYGLDMLIELAEGLKSTHPNSGIIFCFSDINDADKEYLAKLNLRAEEKNIASRIHFKTSYGPFLPILNNADIFVRPTCTDGDANSVREALCMGIPAIASDVVTRPEGTILFRNRDITDFEQKVLLALKKCQTDKKNNAHRTLMESNAAASNYIEYLISMNNR